jgi:hypothetical protein
MADVCISYAHSDAVLARALVAALERRKISVWIDVPGDTEEAVGVAGVPVGQEHWTVIEAEFAAIAVVDTPAWHAREYCQKERGLCTRLGKALHVVADDDMDRAADDICMTLAAHATALSAHARLASRALAAEQQPSTLEKIVSRRTARDAETALAATDSPATVTPDVRAVITRDLTVAQDARRTLRRFSRGALAFLATAAVVAVVLSHFATRFAAEADASEASARAQTLSSESRLATDTFEAVALASEAVELDATSSNDAALVAARTRETRLRSIDLPVDTYLGAAWAVNKQIVLVYTENTITPVDTATGEVGVRVAVEQQIRSGTLNAGPDGLSAVYITSTGQMAWIDLVTGGNSIAIQDPLSALALTETNEVVWASSGDLAIRVAEYPVKGVVDRVRAVSMLPTVVRALDAVGDDVAALGDDGVLRLLRVAGSTLTVEDETRISDRSGSSSGGYRNAVSICGNTLAGVYSPDALVGTKFEWTPDTPNGLRTDRSGRISGPVCTPEGPLSASVTAGALSDFEGIRSISDAPDVYWRIAARDPLHARVAYVSPTPARLVVGDPDSLPMQTAIGSAAAVVPLGNRILYVDNANTVRDADTNEVVGKLGDAYPSLPLTSVLGCDALLGTADGVFHVGCAGSVDRVVDAAVLSTDTGNFIGLRAGGDGEHFVLTQDESVTLLDRGGSVDRVVALPGLSGDTPAEADISADGSVVWIITVRGDVYRVDRSSRAVAPDQRPLLTVTAGNSNTVAALASGDIVVSSSDGRILRVSPDGAIRAAGRLGFAPDAMFVSGNEVVLSSVVEGSAVLRADDLAVIDKVEQGFLLGRNLGGHRLGLARFSAVDGEGTVELGATSLLFLPF